MTRKDDTRKFFHDLGSRQGARVPAARGSAESDVIAAAIALTTLVHLREAARFRPLKVADLDATIDGFLSLSGMAEHEDAMGVVTYRRAT